MADDLEEKIEIWTRFKKAAGDEKAWMHERLTWLFTPQTILVAAYSWLFTERIEDDYKAIIDYLKYMIPALGAIYQSLYLLAPELLSECTNFGQKN